MRARIVLTAVLPLPAVLSAQSIPDEPTCPSCTIGVRDLVVLENSPIARIPGSPKAVLEDDGGKIWLVFVNDLPLVYSEDGALIRQLGPRSKQPEDYEYPDLALPLPGDSMLVFDRNRRVFHVLGPDLQRARSILYPEAKGGLSLAIVEWPESVWMTTYVDEPAGISAPYSVLDLSGTAVRGVGSFGREEWIPGTQRESLFRNLASVGAGHLWSWRGSPYLIERWSSTGERTAVIDRRPSWFPTEGGPLGSREPPPPRVQDVQEDAEGRLWVFSNVAAPTWREGLPAPLPAGPGRREIAWTAYRSEKLYRTSIEVIDPVAGRIVATMTLDKWVVSALPGQRAAIYDSAPDGSPIVRIVQLVLDR